VLSVQFSIESEPKVIYIFQIYLLTYVDLASDQEVSHHPVSMKAQIPIHIRPRGIYGLPSGIGTYFPSRN